MKQKGIITYEIRGNANYRDLVHSIDTKGNATFSAIMINNLMKDQEISKGDELIKLTQVPMVQ